MIQEQRLIEHFMSLVRIDSESGNEREICDVLTAEFRNLGLDVVEDNTASETGHGAGNLIVTLEASGENEAEAAPIFFTCHMDTVTPGKGIKPRLDADGYIRSDGTTILGSDDKAGLAALFEALRVIKEQQLPHGKVQFIITVGEESGLVGARAFDPAGLQAKFGYALDSNGAVGDIAVAAPSQAKITIQIYGKSAHAGVSPEKGISAIQVAAKAVARMQLGRIDHETTANIGSFAGGGATNIVCDYVKLVAEARSLRQDKLTRQVEAMKRAVDEVSEEFGATAAFDCEVIYPAYCYEDGDAVVELAKEAITGIGATPRTFHTGGGSDANVFNGMGVPTVNLAIGYEYIHTTQEQIKAEDLVSATRLVVEIIKLAATKDKH